MSKKVAVTTTSFCESDGSPLQLLKDSGFDVILNPYGRHLHPNEIVEIGREAIGIIAGTEKLDRIVLEQLPHLRVLSRVGVGIDNIDLEATRRLGIRVCITPGAPVIAVAELTVGLVLDLMRRISQSDRELRLGVWKKYLGANLKGKRVGIIGFGRIGQKVAELLAPFGTQIAYYDTDEKIQHPAIRGMTMAELLSWADIVTLHCSASGNGRALMGEKEFKAMKRGSWFLNVARGALVDEGALVSALESGHLGGAAVDVYTEEPYRGRLISFNNVVLTPHIGSYSKESRIQMELEAVKNLIEGLKK